MANGTIELTRFGDATNATLYGRMVWSSVSNGTAANTSTVTVEVQLKRPANSWTSGTWRGTVTIGGTASDFAQYLRVETEWITVARATVTVSHNADGSCACYLYCKVNGPAATSMEGSYVTGSYTVTLDTIPRFASIVSVSNFTDESNPLITYSNPAGNAVTSLQACISLDGTTAKTAYKDVPKTGAEFSMPLTEAERNTLRTLTPNSDTLPVFFLLKTVIGSSSDISVKPAKMNIVNAAPILSPTVVDTNATTIALTGNSDILVALHSTAKVTIHATAQKYATIKSKKIEHGTQVLTGDGTLSVTNNPIKITVTDSRGNSAMQNATNTIVPYINPTCLISNNIPETDGSFALEARGLFYNGAIGKTTNVLTVQYRYKAAGGSYGDWVTFESVSKSGNSYAAAANLSGLDYQTVYTFQVRVIDTIHTDGVTAEKAVVSQPVFDWSQDDFKFNVPVQFSGEIIPTLGTFATEAELETALSALFNRISNNEARTVRFLLSTLGDWTWIGTLFRSSDTYATLDIVSGIGGHVSRITKTLTNGAWTALEWENPPMALGVEYRTRQRYLGKPVYAKVFDVGELPTNTYKKVAHSLTKTAVVALFGASTNGKYHFPSAYQDAASNHRIDLYINSTDIIITTVGSMSGVYAYVVVKYTKD